MDILLAILVWTVFGLICGALARLLVPGRQSMSMLATIMLGVVGSFVGGFLTYLFRGGELLQPSSFLMSLVGAVVVLGLAVSMTKRPAV